jgi:hypothetical protein
MVEEVWLVVRKAEPLPDDKLESLSTALTPAYHQSERFLQCYDAMMMDPMAYSRE